MKKLIYFALGIIIISSTSCKRKKYTEVVEVPLPAANEKMTMGMPEDVKADEGTFEIYSLPYKYDALVPDIDVLTMETHYSKHYLANTNAANKVLENTEFVGLNADEILKKMDPTNEEMKFNVGGYYNHTLFFETIGPKNNGTPKDTLAAKINLDFGSFENFKNQFTSIATKHRGSGWAWLIVNKTGKLEITTTQNNDNPLMRRSIVPGKPILTLDLWEHAYYLDYQYKKRKYIDSYFNIIDWNKVNMKFEEAISK